MGKIALFQLCNQLDFVMGKLAGIFFEDGLYGFGRGRVKKDDCRHILTERFRDAGELLGHDPHADAFVASRKAEPDELSCPAFHVFR